MSGDFARTWFTDVVQKHSGKCRYIICQLEKAPETGALHMQAYVVFNNALAMKGVKTIFGERAHVEIARGTAKQNIDYCSKTDSRVAGPWEHGKFYIAYVF